LLQTQKRLQQLTFGLIEATATPKLTETLNLMPKILSGLQDLKVVKVKQRSKDGEQAKLCQLLFQYVASIKNLEVGCCGVGAGEEDKRSSAERWFTPIAPGPRCSARLHSLKLFAVDLTYVGSNIVQSIDVSALEVLHLIGCKGAGIALGAMADYLRNEQAELDEFLYTSEKALGHDRETSHRFRTTGLQRFLRSLSGLRRLYVNLNSKTDLIPAHCIIRHADSLEDLVANAEHECADAYDVDGFDEICKNCKNLRQLCVSFPETCIEDEHDIMTGFTYGAKSKYMVSLTS